MMLRSATALALRGTRVLWRRRVVVACAVATVCVAYAVGMAWPMNADRYLTVRASSELLDRNGRLMYAYLNEDEQWQFPRALDEISPYLVSATIAVEDQRFWDHCGVDAVAVARATLQNVARARIHSGASTLTMQVVKQADELERSPLDKAVQAWRALRLEWRASKRDILETYLNSAPYGLNLIGCEAASRRYFGKPASELTLSEAALLAGLPKSPVGLMPLKRAESARARRDYVLERMHEEGLISAAEYEQARSEPMLARWHEFPQQAPHLAMRVAHAMKNGARVRTTLDASVQGHLESLAAETLKQFDNDITNAAAIVVDTASAEVLARVGSADFYGTPDGGQVDATRAARSPGSALKPFTYALALEKNLIYPSEMLLDDSLDYGLYNPENYDGKYRGLVSASYALRRSLNVPSIIVLDRIGYSELHRFLLAAGLDTLTQPAEHYGLGLTLGNCEVRLDQLTAAYCMLANLGEYRPLRELDGLAPHPMRLLSRGACMALYEMLEQEFPEEFQRDIVKGKGFLSRVCWKTGTSTGNHDAWAFVFNRHYVVGVWLGNNNGRSSKHLVGARAALPLAARLFRSLPSRNTPDWPEADALREVTVCADSGLPLSAFCPHPSTARASVDQFLNRRCDVHYPRQDTSTEVMQRWPGSPRGWDLADVTATVKVLPNSGARKEGLRILSPSDKAEFVLTGEPNGDKVRARSSADGVAEVHWYLDGAHLGTTGPERTLLVHLEEGEHRLTCMGPSGATDTVAFSVDAPYTPERFKTAGR